MATYTGADKRLQYLFEHGGGGGGSTVSITPTLQSGTKIADYTIDGNAGELYAPSGGGSANIWTGTLAEYIAQASQIADGTQINITDDETQAFIIPSYDIYSEEEREVGVWIDGKPLYQKTLVTSSPITVTQNTWTSIGETINDIDKIIVAKGNSDDRGSFASYPLMAYVDTSASVIKVLSCRPVDAIYPRYFTFTYTKTTDTAGSGIWTPDGGLAEHYSTTERVIGTWIDGSTVYEKTQEGGVTFSAINTWYDTNITGVNKVISVNGSITRDGEPIPIGYFTSAINSTWLLRNNTIKLMMSAKQSGEAYALNSITVKYTKTT